MTPQEALDILLPIDEDKFITGTYQDDTGKCCSLGYLNLSTGVEAEHCINTGKLLQKVIEYINPIDSDVFYGLPNINDGKLLQYQQPTPKQRVVALLQDMVNANIT